VSLAGLFLDRIYSIQTMRLFPHSPSSTLAVKVCGLTRLADALVCAEYGVQAIGINFWPKSKRFHPFSAASAWLSDVPSSVARVALFVNASKEEILPILGSGLFEMVQFHGDESDAFVQQFLDEGLACIRALSARSEADLEKIARCPCRTIILDAYQPGVYGGSGQTCDWELAAQAVRSFPEKHIILSGGLTAQNAAVAMRTVSPAALDLASGVESAPGIKDEGLIRCLMSTLPTPL
jgi:phosphoribosylanthranilate isomerase